jgi:hypothetical protein
MPPPSHVKQPAKEIVVVQELGNGPSSSEGSRKRRKSIVSASPPPKVNGVSATGSEVNGHATTNGSPKVRKANGIGSRGMLVVGK